MGYEMSISHGVCGVGLKLKNARNPVQNDVKVAVRTDDGSRAVVPRDRREAGPERRAKWPPNNHPQNKTKTALVQAIGHSISSQAPISIPDMEQSARRGTWPGAGGGQSQPPTPKHPRQKGGPRYA